MSELISHTPALEIDKLSRRKAGRLTGLLLSTALVAAGCGQQQAQFGGDVKMGPLPTDICITNGRPDILNVTPQSGGDVTLTYIRKDGSLVSTLYLNTPIGYREQGTFIWDANAENCPQR